MRRLWSGFCLVVLVSFLVLGWIGTRIYQEKPPIPSRVVATDGTVLVAENELDHWANKEFKSNYGELDGEQQARLQGRLAKELRTNSYDVSTGTVTVSPVRAEAFQANLRHYSDVFANGRAEYAIPAGAVSNPDRLKKLSAFFFWSSWAASTNRPNDHITYTHNWPYEPLVGNRPTGETVVWTGVSILMLLAGISAMLWWYAARRTEEEQTVLPTADPLGQWVATPSQTATIKYFWVVAALILLQMLLGVVTAHYGVQGDGFYGIPLSKWLPCSVTRTWHVQMGLFWIATAWLAAGLFIGPLVSEHEPAGQRLGVNILFIAMLIVVAGSLTGQWLSVQNKLTDDVSFYFGHQGYEYVDLGRVWQLALFAGLLLWFGLMLRVLLPALQGTGEQKQLVTLLAVASAAIALFYGAGLTWGRHTHLAIVEYWRWWVVHLWVEGFFEVFATTVIAFFFMRLGLIRPGIAAASALLTATIFLSGGIIGTCHHLYFSGTPTVALAWGSVFSALEVVPLTLVGFDAIQDLRRSRLTPWVQRYKWSIYFFVSVAFWNTIGAGLFGFMINPPIALYYMQGLNTTPLHGHAALFGVYGMLGIGLMLVCLRALIPRKEWKEGPLRLAFWSLNGGLMMMCILSLLPLGLMQTSASVDHGYWYARSPEFLQTPLMQNLRWMRVPGDSVFFIGAVALVWFVAGLKTGHSFKDQTGEPSGNATQNRQNN